MRKVKPTHPILDKIASIKDDYIEGFDYETTTKDPQEFLDQWWKVAKGCEDCILCETRTTVVKPDGVASASIMIILEGPGFLEDLAGIPLVGPMELRGSRCGKCLNVSSCYDNKILTNLKSYGGKPKVVVCKPRPTTKEQLNSKFYIRSTGSVVDGILINKWKMSYARHNWIEYYNSHHSESPWTHTSPWFITNIILCRSFDAIRQKDTEPVTVARQKCRKHLAFQWAAVQPKLILCFGRVALGVLLGSEEKAKGVRPNDIVDSKWGPVMFQNHPASGFFMRENNKEIRAFNYAKLAFTFEKALAYVGLQVE